MILYRIATKKFSQDLSGDGAFLKGGRWNQKGVPLLYTASNVSLASLEVYINLVEGFQTKDYDLIVFNVPSGKSMTFITQDKLTANWVRDLRETQTIGSDWVREKSSLILEIPSAIVPIDKNYLLNPNHPAFSTIEIIDKVAFNFDNRLFKTHVF